MRHLDTLEPGERFKTCSFKRAGTVLEQHEGSVRVKWDKLEYFEWNARTEHISRKTEVE